MKLSIITINLNNADGLKKTIESVVSQTYTDYEYIVIDGASTDGSVDVIKQYANKITYWVSEPDKGIFNAMNKGIRQAKGEYLLFLNSGDYINTDTSFNSLLKELDSGEEIVFFNMTLTNRNETICKAKSYPDAVDFIYFMKDSIPHQASFIKRALLLRYGCYVENIGIISDWAFFIDVICKEGVSYKHVDYAFSTYNLDGISSLSENQEMLMNERIAYVKVNYKAFYNLYEEWRCQKTELNKIVNSKGYRIIRYLGALNLKIKKICRVR